MERAVSADQTSAGAGNAAKAAPGVILVIILVVGLIALYWLPTIAAYRRHVPSAASVLIINLFLGWTLIGWVVALAMAFRTIPPAWQQSQMPAWMMSQGPQGPMPPPSSGPPRQWPQPGPPAQSWLRDVEG
jgi:Superinfection immunity protein